MFSNVLVGVDGRQGGRDAIALARQLATPDASIALVHVGRALHDLAEQRDADLLVVGSSRRALLERAVTADDCGAPLNGAPCAIALAPRGYADAAHRLVRLGVGYDGSAQSVCAMSAARALAARDAAAHIKALWVVSLQKVREEQPIPADWPGAIVELLHRCSQRLRELGDVDGAAAFAGPREELARFGNELDLLIVGSCSDGPIGRLVHGSVSNYLVGHAPCPLLVLARSESRDEVDNDREPQLSLIVTESY